MLLKTLYDWLILTNPVGHECRTLCMFAQGSMSFCIESKSRKLQWLLFKSSFNQAHNHPTRDRNNNGNSQCESDSSHFILLSVFIILPLEQVMCRRRNLIVRRMLTCRNYMVLFKTTDIRISPNLIRKSFEMKQCKAIKIAELIYFFV